MTKYVAISDAHLGQDGMEHKGQHSLLCARNPENLIANLAEVVSDFAQGEDVTLIAAGDLIDLSLSFLNESLLDLMNLLRALEPVKELVWVIGNHDHHLWMLHSEEKRVLSQLRKGNFPQKGGVYRSTSLDGESFSLLKELFRKRLPDLRLTIAYPSYRFVLADRSDPERVFERPVYVTHGHLFGGLYTLCSTILRDELKSFSHRRATSTVNFPVIELIYWLLGELGEGRLGANGLVEAIYNDMQRGDDAKVMKLITSLVDTLIPKGVVSVIPDSLERGALIKIAKWILEKKVTDKYVLNRSRERHRELKETQAEAKQWIQAVKMGSEFPGQEHILLYGHTHVADTFAYSSLRVQSFNLGSWLVEPGHEKPDTRVLMIEDGDRGITIRSQMVAL